MAAPTALPMDDAIQLGVLYSLLRAAGISSDDDIVRIGSSAQPDEPAYISQGREILDLHPEQAAVFYRVNAPLLRSNAMPLSREPAAVLPRGDALPHTLPQAMPHTLPQAMPHTLPQARPQALPHTLPQAMPRGDALPQTVPQALPHTVPRGDALPQTLPQAMPRGDALPQTVPQALPHAVPRGDALPHTLPQAMPRGDALPPMPPPGMPHTLPRRDELPLGAALPRGPLGTGYSEAELTNHPSYLASLLVRIRASQTQEEHFHSLESAVLRMLEQCTRPLQQCSSRLAAYLLVVWHRRHRDSTTATRELKRCNYGDAQ